MKVSLKNDGNEINIQLNVLDIEKAVIIQKISLKACEEGNNKKIHNTFDIIYINDNIKYRLQNS